MFFIGGGLGVNNDDLGSFTVTIARPLPRCSASVTAMLLVGGGDYLLMRR